MWKKNFLNKHKISFKCPSQVIQRNLCGVNLSFLCGPWKRDLHTLATLTYELSWPAPLLKVQQCVCYLECQSSCKPWDPMHPKFYFCPKVCVSRKSADPTPLEDTQHIFPIRSKAFLSEYALVLSRACLGLSWCSDNRSWFRFLVLSLSGFIVHSVPWCPFPLSKFSRTCSLSNSCYNPSFSLMQPHCFGSFLAFFTWVEGLSLPLQLGLPL